MKLVINDDSILLNKDEEILQFPNKKDSDIAKEIYEGAFGRPNRHQIEKQQLHLILSIFGALQCNSCTSWPQEMKCMHTFFQAMHHAKAWVALTLNNH